MTSLFSLQHGNLLQSLGLNPQESSIFEHLLVRGSMRVSELSKVSKLSRTNTYNVLSLLETKKLVEIDRSGKKFVAKAAHPKRLDALLEAQETKAKELRSQLSESMSVLVTDFMLSGPNPTVAMFEGMDGLLRVYEDILNDRLTIHSILDLNLIHKLHASNNLQFMAERVRRRITHRIIAPDSARAFDAQFPQPFRQVKYFGDRDWRWGVDVKINQKRLLITTYSSDLISGVVVTNPIMSRSFISLFELLWGFANE